MRRFKQSPIGPARPHTDATYNELKNFRQFGSAIAVAFELPSSLRPEIALLLELFEAEEEGRRLTVSKLGLLDGIAQTTTLRYVEHLKEHGVLMTIPHEHDNRMRYVELMPDAKKALKNAVGSAPSVWSTAYLVNG